jgi:hypothetical protein
MLIEADCPQCNRTFQVDSDVLKSDLALICDAQAQEIKDLKARIGRLESQVNDLQEGTYVNCVYCGHRYGPADSTPVSMADVLTQHVEQCPDHPLSAARKQIQSLTTALIPFANVGAQIPEYALDHHTHHFDLLVKDYRKAHEVLCAKS